MRTRTAIVWILIATGVSAFWGISIGSRTDGFLDFKAVYFAAQCLFQGHNPYNTEELSSVYKSWGGEWAGESPIAIQVITRDINLPTTMVVAAPFAAMPFGPAHVAWFSLAALLLVSAAFLMWKAGAKYDPELALLLIVFLLANCELVFKGGNTALLVVGLCLCAAWFLADDRFGMMGMICLGVCLAVKPHDSGWVWLYFLLAGGIYRKRAMQAFAVSAVFGLTALLWMWRIAPQWMDGWRANLAITSGPGGLNEPGPFSLSGGSADRIIDLQSAASVLWNNPHFYNAVSYAICGAMLLIWGLRTLRLQNGRARVSEQELWLGLAAVVAPTLLITYHRGYDTKLLLLAIPACAMLWSKGGVAGRLAVLFTGPAIVLTGDIALALQVLVRDHLPIGLNGVWQRAVSAILLSPTELALLAMGIFYLAAYVKSDVVLRQDVAEFADQKCDSSDGQLQAVAAVGTQA